MLVVRPTLTSPQFRVSRLRPRSRGVALDTRDDQEQRESWDEAFHGEQALTGADGCLAWVHRHSLGSVLVGDGSFGFAVKYDEAGRECE
jgi:hypothetical protein